MLFNGKDLTGWTPKIAKHDLGDNFGNTFRVEDGLLKVRYDKYKSFDGQFGHLFYKDPFSYYRLVVEYRFVGEQAPGNPGAWALRNSGAMLHSPDPRTMPRDQTFPDLHRRRSCSAATATASRAPRPTCAAPAPRSCTRALALQGSLPEFDLAHVRRRAMGARGIRSCTARAPSRTT